jgi:hypothetical protein
MPLPGIDTSNTANANIITTISLSTKRRRQWMI